MKAKYGRAPAKKNGLLGAAGRENRKFFDSADYAQGGNKATGSVIPRAKPQYPPSITLTHRSARLLQQIATPANIVHATGKQVAPRASLNQEAVQEAAAAATAAPPST